MPELAFPPATYSEELAALRLADRLRVDRRRRLVGLGRCECGAVATKFVVDFGDGDKRLCASCWNATWNRIKGECNA